jgi:hypothetical protein
MVGGKMRRVIFLALILFIWAWSTPNFDRFAQIFGREIDINEENVSGYVDKEEKLWVLGIKWYTKRVAIGGGSPAILPNGKIIPPPPTKYREMRTIPYLYFWLYDKNGDKIKEGAIGDSIGGVIFLPINNGGALIIARVCTDYPYGHHGYNSLILIDKSGVIKRREKLLQLSSSFIRQAILGSQSDKIFLTTINKKDIFTLELLNERINVLKGPKVPQLSPDRRTFLILQVLAPDYYFGWTPVDTATQFGYDPIFKTITWEDYILVKEKIQIATYDVKSNKWTIERYRIPNASIRRFEDFELYPSESVQSVRLNNGNIVVTIFINENDRTVAYQMLFDSLGNYIKPMKTETSQAKDISQIPDESKIYINRTPAEHTKSGSYKGANIYIWGYDLEEGMLYWKKYRIE